MPLTPEAEARQNIDVLLTAAGWAVQDSDAYDPRAGRGIALREMSLKTGFADYLLIVDRQAVGVVEAKAEGATLAGVELQAENYGEGLPAHIPAPVRPLPFLYESTGVETFFCNRLEPVPRSRRIFAFHKPETLAEWLADGQGGQLRDRLKQLPPLIVGQLWSAQVGAITNLERSLAENKPRALIQMATGSGKTFTAVNFIYRLIKFAKARRVLFLVDRNNLGRQTLKEFQQYVTPDDGRKFTELYNVQHLQSNTLDPVSKVCITTIQRLYSMLSGEAEFDPANEEGSLFETGSALDREPPKEVRYNPAIPIEYFDVIVTDECHRSIYNLWRGVLEYFDAFIIGLTATPNKQTFGFFSQNLVMEYNRRRAVADGVNVDGQVYRIRTRITEQGSTVEQGYWVTRRNRQSRADRQEQLDDDLTYTPVQLDRAVQAADQIRTVIRAFREALFAELFPGRREVPKTLIFAKDDAHAEDITRIVREEFAQGDDFCRKITYRTIGDPEALIQQFRNSYYPRIAVTVDMIATGTDIKPLEILLFMRPVQSAGLFEQMLGRGTRVIKPGDLQAVTSDAPEKTHFVIVDAVGVTEHPKVDVGTVERKRAEPFEKLVKAMGFGARDDDTLDALAGRLARLEKKLTEADRVKLGALLVVGAVGGGKPRPDTRTLREASPAWETAPAAPLRTLANALLTAADPDAHFEAARELFGRSPLRPEDEPSPEQVTEAARQLREAATAPFDDPQLRQMLIDVHQRSEMTIDEVSVDAVIASGFDAQATEAARGMVESFRVFIEQNKDAIAALQLLFSRPAERRALTFAQIEDLRDRLLATSPRWTTESLWQAYAQLERDRVRGAGAQRTLTDLIALVRHAGQMDDELIPFPARVRARYAEWRAAQERAGRQFIPEQNWWLDKIAEHVGVSASITADDLLTGEFQSKGGLFKARQVFGAELGAVLDELNAALLA